MPHSREDHIHNVQCVVDSLAIDILNIDLSHITGEAIVNGDRQALCNLLEIFAGVAEYLAIGWSVCVCSGLELHKALISWDFVADLATVYRVEGNCFGASNLRECYLNVMSSPKNCYILHSKSQMTV